METAVGVMMFMPAIVMAFLAVITVGDLVTERHYNVMSASWRMVGWAMFSVDVLLSAFFTGLGIYFLA